MNLGATTFLGLGPEAAMRADEYAAMHAPLSRIIGRLPADKIDKAGSLVDPILFGASAALWARRAQAAGKRAKAVEHRAVSVPPVQAPVQPAPAAAPFLADTDLERSEFLEAERIRNAGIGTPY